MLHSGSDDTLEVVGGGGQRGDFSTVGMMLRETRERYGLTLRDVANALRIRVVYLHALEEGRFSDLPGRPYVTGFLRSYAEYFNLDGDEVVRRYREERADSNRPAKLVFPEPPPESRFPVGAMLAILVVVSIVGYGSWQLIGGGTHEDRPLVAQVPTELALESDRIESEIAEAGAASVVDQTLLAAADPVAPPAVTTRSLGGAMTEPRPAQPAPAPLDAADAAGAASAVAGTPAAPAADAHAPGRSEPVTAEEGRAMFEISSASAASMPRGVHTAGPEGMAAVPGPEPISPSLLGFPNAGETTVPGDLAALGPLPGPGLATAGAAGVATAIESEATTVYGDVNTDARVILRAVADCWIEIKDESGSEVFTRLLRAGEIYKVPNRTDLRLRMGNAGGLEVIVDGTVLPPLGGHGEVMRNVSLDPAVLAASL